MAKDELDKSLEEGFAAQEKALGATPAEQAATADDPKLPVTPEPPKEDPKNNEPATPPKEETTPPANVSPKTEENPQPPETPKTPSTSETTEEPRPLTEEGIRKIMTEMRDTERNSGREVETTTNLVLDAYYPDGLSNVLVDEKTGKQLKTPADVIEAVRAQGGDMTTDEAHQWLLNEQFKLDKDISEIKGQAERIAETTLTFSRDSIAVVEKYEPLFKQYPTLQKKTFDLLMKQVKTDDAKGVILSAPDVVDLYDTYLEPYQMAFEHANGTPATNPNPQTPAAPPPAKPSADDRLDEHGDGGTTEPDDPNNFAQQVNKELAKGI